VIADRTVYDVGARGLAKQAMLSWCQWTTVARLNIPGSHLDAVAAYRWLTTNAASIGGDSKRLALAGESAGGNLALATAVAARDQGLTSPKSVITVYPVGRTTINTESYLKYADAKPLNRPMMLGSWPMTKSSADLKDPRLDLVHANLHGLPPVTLINAEIDPLRDDGAQLEQALRNQGVSVERKLYDGVTHEFFGTAAVVAKAQEAQAYAGARLKAAF
jgi:acetyl esterase